MRCKSPLMQDGRASDRWSEEVEVIGRKHEEAKHRAHAMQGMAEVTTTKEAGQASTAAVCDRIHIIGGARNSVARRISCGEEETPDRMSDSHRIFDRSDMWQAGELLLMSVGDAPGECEGFDRWNQAVGSSGQE